MDIKAFDYIKRAVKSGEDLFYFIRAQHVLKATILYRYHVWASQLVGSLSKKLLFKNMYMLYKMCDPIRFAYIYSYFYVQV